jgi:hypothetical protein
VGGRGSTRWGYRGDYVPRPGIEEAFELRASRLLRSLHPHSGRCLTGQVDSAGLGPLEVKVDGSSWPITAFLCFSKRLRAAGLSLPEDTSIWLLPTQPTYGGERWWFLCPACGCRCGAVYHLGHMRSELAWACRRCLRLVYPSQREGKGERALRRLRKVLRRAGETWSPFCLPRRRPKGMHRKKFHHLSLEATEAFMTAASNRRTARVLKEGRLWG